MNENRSINYPVILAIGFILGCFVLGWKLVESRKLERYVTVKGLSERQVTADRAWWGINCQYGANSVEEIQRKIGWIESEVNAFLKKEGFSKEEINIEGVNVYANNYQGAANRYNADVRVSVTTDDMSKVKEASKSVTDLIGKGILIQADKWASGPKYYFTKFKDLKTEMLAEAAAEAKKAANEFAANSGSVVGDIRRANQGVFQIIPGNQTNEDHVFFSDKLIRVVSTVDFLLE